MSSQNRAHTCWQNTLRSGAEPGFVSFPCKLFLSFQDKRVYTTHRETTFLLYKTPHLAVETSSRVDTQTPAVHPAGCSLHHNHTTVPGQFPGNHKTKETNTRDCSDHQCWAVWWVKTSFSGYERWHFSTWLLILNAWHVKDYLQQH